MGNYRIIYHVDYQETVTVLTVHHSRKLLSNNPAFGEEK
jgi:mRNA-degrading endonuclease RelE of RelBE toxin-antitoxin system